VTARAALVMAISVGALDARADPAPEAAAPSEELLEYLGTWNGDEDWLHSDAMLSSRGTAVPESGSRKEPDPAPARDPSERGT
jgi:hypothetical protein